MHIRKLRKEDIPYLFLLNTSLKKSELTRIIKKDYSIGVFKGEEIISYILSSRKTKKADLIIHSFYSTSISSSVLLWSHFFKDKAGTSIIYSGSQDKLNRYLPFIRKYTKGLTIETEKGETVLTAGELSFDSPHFTVLNILSGYDSESPLNIGLRIFIYELAKEMTSTEIEATRFHIIKSLHRRNKGFLDQIHPNFLISSQTKRPVNHIMKEGYEKKLLEDGFKKIENDKIIRELKSSHSGSYLEWGKFFYDSDVNQILHGHLIEFKSPYYDLTFSFFRSQFKFLKRYHATMGNKSTWTVLDRQGYPIYFVHLIPESIYHLIPRNFDSIFSAALKDLKLMEKLIFLLEEKERHTIYLEDLLSVREDVYDYDDMSDSSDTEDWMDFVRYVVKLKRVVGAEETDKLVEYFFALDNLRDARYVFIQKAKIILNSKLLTKKAAIVFLSDLCSDEEEEERLYLEEFKRLNVLEKNVLTYREVRKRVSSLVKKKGKTSEDFQEAYLETLYSFIINQEGKSYSPAARKIVERIISVHFRQGISPQRLYNLYSLSDNLFLSVEHSTDLSYLKDISSIFKLFKKHNPANLDGYERYLFSALTKINQSFGKEFFRKFALKWRADIERSQDSKSFIHDSGYVYQDFISLAEHLSLEALEKSYLILSHRTLRNLYSEARTALETLRGAELDSHTQLVYEKLEDIILNDRDLSSLVFFTDEELLSITATKYNLSEEDIPQVEGFVNRMKKYNDSINSVEFFSLFKEKALKFVYGEYEGIFAESEYRLPKAELGKLVKLALGDKETKGIVSHPRKLFTKLNQLGNVQDFMKGDIPDQLVNSIVSLLKERRVDIPKEAHIESLFKGLIERKCSPEFLVAGDASVCCMSFGEDNAYDYAVQKGFGVYNIYFKERIIANSVLWINEKDNSLVIDNVEVHPNYKKFNSYIRDLYFLMIQDVLNQYNLTLAVQGKSYNDLNLSDKSIRKRHSYKGRGLKSSFYTDAEYISPILLNT